MQNEKERSHLAALFFIECCLCEPPLAAKQTPSLVGDCFVRCCAAPRNDRCVLVNTQVGLLHCFVLGQFVGFVGQHD
ncbi:MAG: hypothetical protein KF828_08540, partial [Anaerolineales bacterium]|nr:hypothetical protein [Anaerolineales bacterium]